MAIETSASAMVRVSVDGAQWTGVMIDPNGTFLTATDQLGNSPRVDFVTEQGATGSAWLVGRDDAAGLALFRVIAPTQLYAAVSVVAGQTIQLNQEMGILQYASAGVLLDKRTTQIVGFNFDGNTGLQYVKLLAGALRGSEGGALVDNQSTLRGIRISDTQMVSTGIGKMGEAWAMTADGLALMVLPTLQSGYVYTRPNAAETEFGAPPPIPAIFSGDITIGGAPAVSGSRLYARLVKSGKPDLWVSSSLTTTGRYLISLSILQSGYEGAQVEFWFDGQKSITTGSYVPGQIRSEVLSF
ncbi:MAG: serine protease [Chloroflexota bacterium]